MSSSKGSREKYLPSHSSMDRDRRERDRHHREPSSSHHRQSSTSHHRGSSSSHHHHRHRDEHNDREERNRLDERLRRSEDERTKNLASRKDPRHISEIAKKHKLDPAKDHDRLMEETRKKSRTMYLKSRATKQIEIFREDLKDEKSLFSDIYLTKRERERIEYQEKILGITESTIEASEKAKKTKQYLMPDGQSLDYGEKDEEEGDANAEHKKWEKAKFDDAKLGSRSLKDTPTDGLSDKLSDLELLLGDEFLERVKRGDTFQEEFVDTRKLEKEAREKEREQLREQRKNLPVYEHKHDLLKAIDENQIIIVQGETGCGKTTQIPQYLHEAGYTKTEMKHGEVKMIGCTQPRRVAAMSVAARVSQEVNSKLGHMVGYSIRFEDCTSEGTVIKYMTDGMLLREILDDPTLSKYSVMIVDEAHERTLHTDILLTLLKDVTRARSDFKLIISSATLDEQKFLQFFEHPPVFRIKGRLFHVEHRFMSSDQKTATANMTDSCLRTVMQIHRINKPGDILVFLPGQDEIEELQKDLETQVKKLGSSIRELLIRPIYANLPTDMQSKVFDPTPQGARKVVLATNIAETSITIDGIVFVVDPGYCKQNRFSSKTGMETLAVTRISKASADQRAGRAGRNRPGMCFRLYTRDEFNTEFEENTQPEIQRLNLANVVLLLKTMKINDVINFEYVDRPPTDALLFAIEQLTSLGALDQTGELTLLGRRMAEFPLEPKMSKAIIVSESYGCSEEVLTIMSMLSVNGSIFFKPKDRAIHAEASRKSFFSVTGDHLMLLKVYNDWAASDYSKQWCFEKFVQYKSMCRARDIRDQLEKLCEKVEIKLKSNTEDTSKILKSILGGFFYHVARISREGGSYRTIKKNQSVHIHPTSALHDTVPRWVVFNEIKLTTREYMRNVSEIEPSWLVEVAPCFYDKEEIEEMSKKKMPKFNRGKSRAELNPKYG
uniref:RNA helicase n=1 Tax=Aceria tosichella TaxID=561515 RepID=A0A6G1S622_9ACAR